MEGINTLIATTNTDKVATQTTKEAAPLPAAAATAPITVSQQATETASKEQPPVVKEKYMRAMPNIKMNLRYKPMEHITKADHYIVHVPKCYSDALNFNWGDRDYQI